MVLSFWLQRSLKVLPHLGGRAQDVKSQAFFAAFLFSLHMLLLFSQFIIITVYVYVDRTSTVAAGLFLSLSTSGSELLATSWTETFYTKLVWPRAGDQPAVVWGDQNSIATVLLAWAHSMAEGSRLVCLLCAAARSTSWYWGWFANVALMIFCNLSVRHGYHVSALVRVLPWAARSLKPCCFALILRQARFMCGYYRFLAIGTYALWRVFWLGAEPLFNTQTLVLFITVLVAEVVEDTVVLRRWLPLDVWRDQLKHCYWALHPFHPRQAMCKDHRGVHVKLPPLRLHGARVLSKPLNVPLIHITASIVVLLMWLPLGLGFILGFCPRPVLTDRLLAEVFVWPRPWRC